MKNLKINTVFGTLMVFGVGFWLGSMWQRSQYQKEMPEPEAETTVDPPEGETIPPEVPEQNANYGGNESFFQSARQQYGPGFP